MSFLVNPDFWQGMGGFAGFAALLITLYPELRKLIEKPKLRIKVPELFTLWHYLGNLQAAIYLEIRNTGARSVNIERFDCWIAPEDPNKPAIQLPVQTYYSQQSVAQQQTLEYPIGSTSLKSGTVWFENIHCYRLWSEAEENRLNKLQRNFKKNIAQKAQATTTNTRLEVDDALAKEATDFFKTKYSQFNLEQGNYQLFLAALAEGDRVLCVQGYRFTLFESKIDDLNDVIKEYKYGAGIHLPYVEEWFISVRLRRIDEAQTLQTYRRLRPNYKL